SPSGASRESSHPGEAAPQARFGATRPNRTVGRLGYGPAPSPPDRGPDERDDRTDHRELEGEHDEPEEEPEEGKKQGEERLERHEAGDCGHGHGGERLHVWTPGRDSAWKGRASLRRVRVAGFARCGRARGPRRPRRVTCSGT